MDSGLGTNSADQEPGFRCSAESSVTSGHPVPRPRLSRSAAMGLVCLALSRSERARSRFKAVVLQCVSVPPCVLHTSTTHLPIDSRYLTGRMGGRVVKGYQRSDPSGPAYLYLIFPLQPYVASDGIARLGSIFFSFSFFRLVQRCPIRTGYIAGGGYARLAAAPLSHGSPSRSFLSLITRGHHRFGWPLSAPGSFGR